MKSGNPMPRTRRLDRERLELLHRLENRLEVPMLVLAFVWLVLLVIDFVRGESHVFQVIGTAIWIVFLIDFAVKFLIAPSKGRYLKSNWLTAFSLLMPALRIVRIARVARLLRVARAARGVRLIRVLASINRGMRALGASFARRGFGYVIALTCIVTIAGAAAMYAFESGQVGGPGDYGAALWWTAMIMTTMGSEYWPRTIEGRLLCFLLALYAFAIFGYVTATIATFFVGRDAAAADAEIAGTEDLRVLRREMSDLLTRMQSIESKLDRLASPRGQTPER